MSFSVFYRHYVHVFIFHFNVHIYINSKLTICTYISYRYIKCDYLHRVLWGRDE